jgi:Secretion system C-terminal sorting domain/Cleaved Adhesin Domain
MKKLLLYSLLLFSGVVAFAQSDYNVVLPNSGTSTGVRGPQGAYRYNRSVWIITAAEMTATMGLANGDVVNGIGFNFVVGHDVAVTANMQIYLQNTADATNTKSTSWATAISTMTSVSNGSVTLPVAAGQFNIPFSGGSTFTYTGGALYVAFDYQNATGTLASTTPTASAVTATTALTAGSKTANSLTAAPVTIASSNFRPETFLGKAVLCAKPTLITSSNITNTSADINFTAIGGGTVSIEYGPYGFLPATGAGTIVTSTTSPKNITGLTPSTVYDYYLRKDCGGASGQSIYAGPFSFNTPFLPAVPTYSTSFEQESFPFLGWSLIPGTPVGSDWQIVNFGLPSATNTLTQDGETSIYSFSGVTTAPANNYVISRGIDLTANSTVSISFYARNYQAAAPPATAVSTGTASYKLTVGNSQTVAAQTTVVATETPFASTAWAQKSYTFTPPTSGVYYFGIQNTSPANTVGQQALFVDNLVITQTLSAKDFVAEKFSTFPNPVKNIISISNSENINVKSISISDLNGRVIKTENFSNVSDINVNVSDLSSGMYLLNINSDQGIVIKKIVKE